MFTTDPKLIAMDKAIAKYYEKHPEEEQGKTMRQLALVAAPFGLIPVLARAASLNLGPAQMLGSSAVAALSGVYTDEALRRKRILNEMGIETNVLRTSQDPFNFDKGVLNRLGGML